MLRTSSGSPSAPRVSGLHSSKFCLILTKFCPISDKILSKVCLITERESLGCACSALPYLQPTVLLAGGKRSKVHTPVVQASSRKTSCASGCLVADVQGSCAIARCVMRLHVATTLEKTSCGPKSLGATCEQTVDWVGYHRVAFKRFVCNRQSFTGAGHTWRGLRNRRLRTGWAVSGRVVELETKKSLYSNGGL